MKVQSQSHTLDDFCRPKRHWRQWTVKLWLQNKEHPLPNVTDYKIGDETSDKDYKILSKIFIK